MAVNYKRKTYTSFETWYAAAEVVAKREIGVSLEDIADCPYRDWYEYGLSPKQSVAKARKRALED